MTFWDKETCEYCHGQIIGKKIDLPRKVGIRYILIKKVPAGVCRHCGTKYYTANVLKTIRTIMQGKKKAESKIPMAVYSL